MKLTYHRCDDCLPPDLTIPDKSVTLGKYGRLCKTYLKKIRRMHPALRISPEGFYGFIVNTLDDARYVLDHALLF